MTILRARKIVLRAIAASLNDSYVELFNRVKEGRLTYKEARLIGAELESLEDMAGYLESEADGVNRDGAREAVAEVSAIWRKEGQ
ncbi:MAG: hypothetical protein LBI57_04240 [Helicobacteraceae bacterium]|jgi:hypothetical protein|nr:hypothetical protein [Helicobacteraceae bacterium]